MPTIPWKPMHNQKPRIVGYPETAGDVERLINQTVQDLLANGGTVLYHHGGIYIVRASSVDWYITEASCSGEDKVQMDPGQWLGKVE